MSTCGAYVITHVKSGKFYVGSSVNIAQRIRTHRSFLKYGQHPNKELQKLYADCQELSVKLWPTDDRETAYKLEQRFIDESQNDASLLNVAKDVKSPGKGRTPDDDTRKKLSESCKLSFTEERRVVLSNQNKGIKIPEERRQRIAAAKKGELNPMFGVSPTTIKSVIAKGVRYKSLTEASVALGVPMPTLSRWTNSPDEKYSEYRYE